MTTGWPPVLWLLLTLPLHEMVGATQPPTTSAPTAAPTAVPTKAPTAAPTVNPFNTLCPTLSLNYTNFAILTSAGSVTPSSSASLVGDVASNLSVIFSSGAMTGDIFSPIISLGTLTLTGSTHAYDARAAGAYAAAKSLFLELRGLPCGAPITNETQVFQAPGVYCFVGNYHQALSFTVDAQNQSDRVYILQFVGNVNSLASTSAAMILAGGARACNIFFVISGDFTPHGDVNVYGQFLVAGNINPPSGMTVEGKLVALGPYNAQQNNTADNGNVNPGGNLTVLNCECAQGPTGAPTVAPTRAPTAVPTKAPTHAPTENPTVGPTNAPTRSPTESPTTSPTRTPTAVPTHAPTVSPTETPTKAPTKAPSGAPTMAPTRTPTIAPTIAPTENPTGGPTTSPTQAPTPVPTNAPTVAPTNAPTTSPTRAPTETPTSAPTASPTGAPTRAPTEAPTSAPTVAPTEAPSQAPTHTPTVAPTETPTSGPTEAPTHAPTAAPTETPTEEPTEAPTGSLTRAPTEAPTKAPTFGPTRAPTTEPTEAPTSVPTGAPTHSPTAVPTSECPAPSPTPVHPLQCPREAAALDDFALLTYQGNINPASTVVIEGSVGAVYSVVLLNGTVVGDLYSQNRILGGGLVLNGSQFGYNSVALNAYSGAQLLYQTLNALPCTGRIVCPSQTFVSGVYCYNGSLLLPHRLNLTFDARGDPEAIFVLSISGHIQGQGGQMNLINGAQACNIFILVHGALQPAHSATLFGVWLVAGNIDAVGDIELTGKFVSLGPGTPQAGNVSLLQGQGDINPSGALRINPCACYSTMAPTRAPSRTPTSSPTRLPSRAPSETPTLTPTTIPWVTPHHSPVLLGIIAGASVLITLSLLVLLFFLCRRRRRRREHRH
jgi:hypothetical protein